MDELVGNPGHDVTKYCFAKPGEVYLVYLPNGGEATLDLSNSSRKFFVHWFNPRQGGGLIHGEVSEVLGGGKVNLGPPPSDKNKDWLVYLNVTQ